MTNDLTTTAMSIIAESWILLDGKPFRLDDWPTHRAFYDGRYRRTLFKTSRQVAKSTTLANFNIIECALMKHWSTMFVSPTKEQTVRFSNTRVGKTMRYSPIINNTFLSTDLTDRVFHKQFSNGSEMLFTYGNDDADRLRGPSTHRNMYDEIQDLLYDPIITVGNETMSNSDYAFETYAGTPKTMENTIQFLWELSTETEWVMKCEGCGTHQFIDDEKSLGLKGPICVKCGKYINPFFGQWIDMSPVRPEDDETEEDKLKGFHLSQPIMPINVPMAMTKYGTEREEMALRRWKRILTKHRESPSVVFRNEVLGISDAVGTRMISKDELRSLCVPDWHLLEKPHPGVFNGITKLVAGIDWSGGGTSGVSRTALWIWGFRPADGRLICMFCKAYPGRNPVHLIDEMAVICSNYRVELVVGDAGEGHTANNLLREKLGAHRVVQAQYGAQKTGIKWNDVDRYMLDRTIVIDNFFMMLKNKGVQFASLDEMLHAMDDILNVFEEVTKVGKKIWNKSPNKSDDLLHAAVFGWLAFKITQQDLKLYQ